MRGKPTQLRPNCIWTQWIAQQLLQLSPTQPWKRRLTFWSHWIALSPSSILFLTFTHNTRTNFRTDKNLIILSFTLSRKHLKDEVSQSNRQIRQFYHLACQSMWYLHTAIVLKSASPPVPQSARQSMRVGTVLPLLAQSSPPSRGPLPVPFRAVPPRLVAPDKTIARSPLFSPWFRWVWSSQHCETDTYCPWFRNNVHFGLFRVSHYSKKKCAGGTVRDHFRYLSSFELCSPCIYVFALRLQPCARAENLIRKFWKWQEKRASKTLTVVRQRFGTRELLLQPCTDLAECRESKKVVA